MSIQDCKDLVKRYLEAEFPVNGTEEYALVKTNPERILESSKVALWVQSLTGEDVRVNMRAPRVRDFLKSLAEHGPGYADDHENVRYKIVVGMYPPAYCSSKCCEDLRC